MPKVRRAAEVGQLRELLERLREECAPLVDRARVVREIDRLKFHMGREDN